jgi:RNA polymerase sigma-70 factor (ECF subfamily)
MVEDKLLIWWFKHGPPWRAKAVERIYCKYEALLLTIAAAIAGDRGIAEDVVHDVFVAFAQSPGKVRLDGNLRNYLATCVANKARDAVKARRNIVPVDEVEFLVPQGQQPDVVAARQEQLRLAWSALAQLPSEQREVLVLHLIAGLKFRQIAANLGISINTAQSRYRYGLEKMRSALDGEITHDAE